MKNGIDYFPLDVVLDSKFELIEAEFGLTGFAVVVKLYQRIYGGQGYYCEYTNEVASLFAKKEGVGENVVSEIVSASIRRGIFDKEKFDKYHILTSAGIQKRYFEAVKRRKTLKFDERYLLVPCAQNQIIACKNDEIACKNGEIAYKSKQSREEKSRVEKSRVEESDTRTNRGRFANVFLSEKEYSALGKEIGFENRDKYIEKLSLWLAEPGHSKQNHFATILKWYSEDNPKKDSSFETEDFWSAALKGSYGEEIV